MERKLYHKDFFKCALVKAFWMGRCLGTWISCNMNPKEELCVSHMCHLECCANLLLAPFSFARFKTTISKLSTEIAIQIV